MVVIFSGCQGSAQPKHLNLQLSPGLKYDASKCGRPNHGKSGALKVSGPFAPKSRATNHQLVCTNIETKYLSSFTPSRIYIQNSPRPSYYCHHRLTHTPVRIIILRSIQIPILDHRLVYRCGPGMGLELSGVLMMMHGSQRHLRAEWTVCRWLEVYLRKLGFSIALVV